MFFKALMKKNEGMTDGGALTIRIGENIVLDIGCFVSVVPREEQAKITDVFLTHAHLDHIKDLGFLGENLFGVFKETVRVWGTGKTLKDIKDHVFNGKIWPDFTRLPGEGKPVMRFEKISARNEYKVSGYGIMPVPVNHSDGAVGYVVKGSGENVVVTGDTGPTEEIWNVTNALRGSVTVFVETSFPTRLEGVAKSSGHLTPRYLEGELKKIKRDDVQIYIYHIKPPYFDEIVSEINRLRDKRVKILGQ